MPNCLTLKKSNCKNCYKCIRHCPVKSIRFSGNQAHIIGNECILCGQCFVVCPQNAKEIVEFHGGAIAASSSPVCTRFTVKLPRHQEEQQPAAAKKWGRIAKNGGKE